MDNFIELLYARFLLSDGVSIDTRTLIPGNLFFGLRGPNFNGSAYASQALEKGASYVVIDDPSFYEENGRYILCEDALDALQKLAIFHRSKYKRPVFALTGSNGKTTTKELIAAVLEKKYIIQATQGNLNNHIGVPLTVLDIYPQVEIAIVEMGANHVGDIAELCRIANPTHGLITNIGHAHTELFGGIEGVLRGKTELFDHLRKEEGKPFVNTRDERLAHMIHRFEKPEIFPAEDVHLLDSKSTLRVMIGRHEVTTHLFGCYNYQNIAAAVTVGRYFEVSDELISEAIGEYKPANMRSQIIEKDGIRLILDAYNANPDSMSLALAELAKNVKPLAILGDMYEIENFETQHQQIGNWLNENSVEAIFVGNRMKHAHEAYDGSSWYPTAMDAFDDILQMNLKGRTVLLKASRSMKLETLKDAILKS